LKELQHDGPSLLFYCRHHKPVKDKHQMKIPPDLCEDLQR
jgi:hypothetical protein